MAPDHDALRIPEIVIAILQYLSDHKQALSRFAQCCQSFTEPASNILWRYLPSVRPLQKLLPTVYADNGSFKKVGSDIESISDSDQSPESFGST